MKLTVTRNELFLALSRVSGVVDKKKTHNVLECVLLSAEDDKLKIVGTDLEIEAKDVSTCTMYRSGSIATPSAKLIQSVKSLAKDAVINLELTGHTLTLTSGRKKFELTTQSAQDFPDLNDIQHDQSLQIEERELRELLASVSHSMADKDVRYYLNGAYLKPEDNSLTAVSTDGHRLTLNSIDAECSESNGCIVPRKAVIELIKSLSAKSDEVVSVNFSGNHFQVVNQDYAFTTKLIDGRYPDYKSALPQQDAITNEVSINRDRLKSALNSVAICTNDKFRGIRLMFDGGDVRINANNPEGEVSTDYVSIDGFNGESFEIGFNVDYMLDAVNSSSDEFVTLSLTTPATSATMTCDENDVINVLMPVRL